MYFWVKQDIQQENKMWDNTLSIRNWLDCEKWALQSRTEAGGWMREVFCEVILEAVQVYIHILIRLKIHAFFFLLE